jgi:hypothetical protein
MSLTIVNRTDTFEGWRTKTNTISTHVGDISLLDAGITADTNLTDAVNELQGDIGVQALSNFTATTLRGAANEIRNSNITFNGNKGFSDNVSVQGTLGVQGATTLQGVLGVQGATTLGSSLAVQGAAVLQGTVDIQGGLSLASALLSGNLGVQGATSLQGALGVQGNTTLGDATNDSTLVNGSLTVKGADFKVQTSGAVDKFTVDDATGDTVISGNLQVLGATTITGATTLSANFNTLINKPSPVIAVTLTGDVTGSGSATLTDLGAGTYTASFATTIGANSVALGTDTTGNYIATAAAGTGITVSGSGSEDAAITITNSDRGSSQSIFKNIAVAGQSTVIADQNDDTLTLVAGSNISLTTNAGADTITINGIASAANNGTITLAAGSGMSGGGSFTVDQSGPSTVTLTNSDRGSSQNIFKNFAVAGQTTVAADTNTATLNLAAGDLDGTIGIVITTNNTSKTVSIAHNNTSSQDSVNNSAGNVIQDVTLDTYGHITGLVSVDLDNRYIQGSGGIISGNLTINGDLTIGGTTTTVNTETINLADNQILLNSNFTGSNPTENGGIEIERGTQVNKTLIWNEADDKWTVGSETFVAATFEGALTGAVTGNVTGNVTGSSGSCTGNAATATIANSIVSQANSATITATNANTANLIVLRDASGNFSAGTITAALAGNASTATNVAYSGLTGTVPTWNQNTTGLAANVTGTVAIANGGTGATTAAAALTALGAYPATNPSGYTTNTGTVTSVSGSAPVVSTGGTTPTISMAAASAGANGYMTTAYASKLDGIAAGATNVTNTNQLTNGAGYTTNTGTVTSVSGSGNVSGLTLTGSITTSGTLTLGGSINNLNQNTTGTASNITDYTINQNLGTGNSPTFASVTAGSYNATSSLRYKENIVPMADACSLVKQLRGVRYDRKDGTVKNDVGVIAEEVQQLIPAIVGLNSEGMADSVDYGRLSAVLIEAVKDILVRLEKLESK